MSWTTGYTSEQWAAAGACVQALAAVFTVIVAIRAIRYARRQVEEARKLRVAQTQPYVTASLEPAGGQIAQLVIRNQGQTPAYNVRFRFSPEYRPAYTQPGLADFTNSKLWREGFPSMVPGQSISILIDTFPARARARDLPRSYEVTVEFEDHEGKLFDPLRYVVDFEAFFEYNHVNLKTIHDVAEQLGTLGAIAAQLGRINEGLAALAEASPADREQDDPVLALRRPAAPYAQARSRTRRVAGSRRRPAHDRERLLGLDKLPMEPLASSDLGGEPPSDSGLGTTRQ